MSETEGDQRQGIQCPGDAETLVATGQRETPTAPLIGEPDGENPD